MVACNKMKSSPSTQNPPVKIQNAWPMISQKSLRYAKMGRYSFGLRELRVAPTTATENAGHSAKTAILLTHITL